MNPTEMNSAHDTMLKTDSPNEPPRPGYTLMNTGDPYLDYLGALWIKIDEDAATLLLRAERCHTNANGTVHGGVLMALMDVALALSLDHTLKREDPASHAHAITMQLSCSMIGAGALGDWLVAQGTLDRTTRSMGFASGRIIVGDRLLMTGTALFKRPSPLARQSQAQG